MVLKLHIFKLAKANVFMYDVFSPDIFASKACTTKY